MTYRKAPLAGAKVTLTDDAEETLEAVTAEDGTFKFDAVRHSKSYTLKATCEKFNDYTAAEPLVVENDDVNVAEIAMDKPNANVTGVVKCGDEIVAGAKVKVTSKNTYGMETELTTDTDGMFTVALPQDVKYMFAFEAEGYEPYALTDSVEITGDYDFGTVELKALTVDIVMPEGGYLAYSSDKALDFSVCDGLKAYVVTEVKMKNDAAYVVMAEVAKVPAKTGVILVAAAGDYTARVALDAEAVETNLLINTADEAYKAKADEKNIVWTLGRTTTDKVAFTTADDIEVPQGSAYLRFAAEIPYIYINEADVPKLDGINGVSANGALDLNAPMYDLSGQKVGKEYKGIVIQKGKKYSKK